MPQLHYLNTSMKHHAKALLLYNYKNRTYGVIVATILPLKSFGKAVGFNYQAPDCANLIMPANLHSSKTVCCSDSESLLLIDVSSR
jgi:hypothetical protein